MGKFIDLTGMRFGRLIVLEKIEGKLIKYLCQCDCGNTKIANGYDLRRGAIKSCGCLHKETTSKINKKHGGTGTRLFSIWRSMKNRCKYPYIKDYKYYGGNGINVCEEWQEFLPFQQWAISNGYQENLSIDRINNDGNYEPKNCRWVDLKIQGRNKKNNVLLTFNNETHCVAEWAEILNINPKTIYNRIYNGKTTEEVLKK